MSIAASVWVERFAPLVPVGERVLDLACGRGRHTRLFLDRGHPVLAVDCDVADLADAQAHPALATLAVAAAGLVRFRAKMVNLRSGLKAQVHAVLAKEGVAVPMSDLFGVAGPQLLDDCALAEAYTVRVESLRDILEVVGREVTILERRTATALKDHAGYQAIQAIHGVGLCSWAGLTPRDRESDTTVHRGHITKQGSRLVRWAAVEAVARQRTDTPIRAHHHRVADRWGKAIGRVAAARKLLTLVYNGLRDGEIRCLAEAG